MTDIIMIPLSKLVESEDNVRRSDRRGGVSQIAASIEAVGLLQSLVVRTADKGKYAVIAGGRRLRALKLLAKAGSIAKNERIPCRIVSAASAIEMSLAENVVRCGLSSADEIVATAQLAADGLGVETIAARFGVSPMHVARRLKLARVSPRLIEALRREEINLDQLAALAFSDDHAAQDAAFFDAPEWARSPERLKAQVTQAHVPETDKLARFVGVETYEAEGGAIVSDLFAEDDDTRWLCDRGLLTSLAEAKLGPIADAVRAEGWVWVEIAIDGLAWEKFPERVRERRRELSEQEHAEREQLYVRLDETEDEDETQAIEAALDGLAQPVWDPAEFALAGAIVTIGHDGAPKIERGLVKLEDVKPLRALRRGSAQHSATEARQTPALPAKLMDELMAHKTLALRNELARQPDLALRLLVFTLASEAFAGSRESCLGVRVETVDVARSITRTESQAASALQATLDARKAILPEDAQALWDFTGGDQQDLLALLAELVAPSLDLRPAPNAHGPHATIGEIVADAAGLDMRLYWSATPESFFEHVRKPVIVDALIEAKPTLDRAKLLTMPKSELVSRAKRIFKDRAWLPEPLRTHSHASAPALAIAAE